MNTLLFIISLLFVVQVVTNIILLVRFFPKKQKKAVNISDIMTMASQIVGADDESI